VADSARTLVLSVPGDVRDFLYLWLEGHPRRRINRSGAGMFCMAGQHSLDSLAPWDFTGKNLSRDLEHLLFHALELIGSALFQCGEIQSSLPYGTSNRGI